MSKLNVWCPGPHEDGKRPHGVMRYYCRACKKMFCRRCAMNVHWAHFNEFMDITVDAKRKRETAANVR